LTADLTFFNKDLTAIITNTTFSFQHPNMKTQKSITIALLLSLMTFIIEVEVKYAPDAFQLLQAELLPSEAITLESLITTEKKYCKVELPPTLDSKPI